MVSQELSICPVFCFAIAEISKNSHLLPNLSFSYDLYSALESDHMTLERDVFWLSEGKQTAPNYNCQRERKSLAIVTGTASVFSAKIGTLLELYKMPQVSGSEFW